jgi:hypothetical protein
MKKIIIALLSMSLPAIWPCAARAQLFGSGIVYDPTQSAHAITQIENEGRSLSNQAQQIENGQQIFTNTVKIASTALQTYNQIVQQYNLYHQMMVAPQLLYGRFLSPQTDLMMTQQIANHYGNGSGAAWVNSSNTGMAAGPSIQVVSLPPLTAAIPTASITTLAGQQQLAAQGATVDLGDSVAATELQTIGSIKANQTARQGDITALENATNTTDPSQQTEMAVLQRINRALLLQLRTMQDANQINANAALEQMVFQKQQQDAMKATFRDSTGYQNYYNANITTTSGGAANMLTQVY